MKQKVLHIICIITGIVFIVSGLGKIVNTAAFGDLMVQYGLGWLQLFAPLIALVEFAVGVSLVLSVKPKIMLYTSAGLLLMFTAAFTYGHFKNGVADCGCFGMLGVSQGNVPLVYARNILLLGLSLYAGLCYPACCEKTDDSKKTILSGILLPAIFVAGLTFPVPAAFRQEQPHFMLNRDIKETPLYQYIQTAPDSSYLVFFYTYACQHCINSVENFKHFKRSGIVDSAVSFALVDADSGKNATVRNLFVHHFGNFGTREIANSYMVQSFVHVVPTAFYIKNDTIRIVIESQLPSPVFFGVDKYSATEVEEVAQSAFSPFWGLTGKKQKRIFVAKF